MCEVLIFLSNASLRMRPLGRKAAPELMRRGHDPPFLSIRTLHARGFRHRITVFVSASCHRRLGDLRLRLIVQQYR